MSRAPQDPILIRKESSDSVQYNEGKVGYLDWWLGLRDRLLNGLSGIKSDDVLNVEAAGGIPKSGIDPAAELKRSLDSTKIAAVDYRGAHVDYAALRESTSY